MSETSANPPKIRLKTKVIFAYYKFLNRIKKTRIRSEKAWINFFIILAFTSILIGLIIFIAFLLKLNKEYTIHGENILLDKTGQVGDFVGGIVGAIWSLTGVLLFYATLRLQSKELKENRVHFQLSRLTDVVYKQLDLFNDQLKIFELKDIERDSEGEHIKYSGRSAVILLSKRFRTLREIEKNKTEEEKQSAMLAFMGKNFAFIEINREELKIFFEELDTHVDNLRSVFIKEDIPPDD